MFSLPSRRWILKSLILNAGRLQRERRTNNTFSKQNNNFARAALFCSFQFVTKRLRRENAKLQVLWRTQTHHDEFLFLLLNLGSVAKNSIPGKFT